MIFKTVNYYSSYNDGRQTEAETFLMAHNDEIDKKKKVEETRNIILKEAQEELEDTIKEIDNNIKELKKNKTSKAS